MHRFTIPFCLSLLAGLGVASAQLPENALPMRIGVDQAGTNRFGGEIVVVRLHDHALTAKEVADLLAGGRDGKASAAVVWHKGDADQLATVLPFGAGGGSIEAWLKPGGSTGRIFDKITPGGIDGILLDTYPGHAFRLIVGGERMSVPVAFTGQWVHVVAALDAAGGFLLYVDGKRHGSGAAPDGLVYTGSATPPDSPLTLWYARPATRWTEALAIGNGRLGGMVWGGVVEDRVDLNEDTLWSGEPFVPQNPNALAALPEVRKLLVDGKEGAAHQLFNQKMLGPYNQCYMPLGSLQFRFPVSGEVQEYQRSLDLRTGLASVRYRHNGVTHARETFTSFPDQALVTRIAADQPGQVSFSASLSSLIRHQVKADGQVLRLTGRCPAHADPHYLGSRIVYDEGPNPKGMTFAVELRAIAEGGRVTVTESNLVAEGCDAVTLVLVAATSYNGFDKSPSREGRDPIALCRQQGTAAAGTPFAALRKRQVGDFSALMDRVSLDLGRSEASRRPTNARLGGGLRPEDVPALTALYYQFGRYLLVSSSRPGSQPANLQGIWNRSMNPPWSANWTMNCNANFNYLGLEAANLPELHEPFIRLVKEWSVDGARTATNWYGCKGWVGHHNCDLWRNACPVGGNAVWAAFPCGGAWACQDLWEHYAFTLDRNYLREVWPTLRGAAEFFLDFLIEDPKTGHLVTAPDTNFENSHSRGPGLSMGPTPSTMMVRQLFKNCIAAAEVLGTDAEVSARMAKALDRLPPTQVDAKTGEIQEYLDPGLQVTGRGACELLTTWGLIWCDQLTPRDTPELCAALRKAYEAPDRRPWITGQVGSWQGAFPANTFARLGDGDRVNEILAKHFQVIPHPNLTAGFIQSEWEIDGNLGIMAAIGEMLLQSQEEGSGFSVQGSDRPELRTLNAERYTLSLLPALPSTWRQGSVQGLKARGNITVDMEWKDGRVTSYTLRSPQPVPVSVRVNGEVRIVTPKRAE